MHIVLSFHDDLPVRGYGGTQRVVVWLARGLAELGHRVSLIAGDRSRVPEATLIPVPRREMRTPGFDLAAHIPPDADLLHAHAPVRTDPGIPWVWTLHGNSRNQPLPPNTICLSASHARRHGTAAFVYNGLDPAEYEYRETKGRFDLFLGRLHRVKGYDWAVRGARRSRRRLIVAGGWRPSLSRWLRYAGSVDGARKRRLLAEARCLWMPAQWPEPFGLTLIEALASGTPVLGTTRGALPEIVSPEVGALGETLDDLVRLAEGIDRIDPAACRRRVEQRFSHRVMAEGYLRMYREYLERGVLPPGRVEPAG